MKRSHIKITKLKINIQERNVFANFLIKRHVCAQINDLPNIECIDDFHTFLCIILKDELLKKYGVWKKIDQFN